MVRAIIPVLLVNHVKIDRHPLRLNVGFIKSQAIGYSRDFEFEYPAILLEPDLNLIDFSGVLRIGRTPQGLVCQGDFHTQYQMDCVRCLGPAIVQLSTSFNELYAFSERDTSESELLLPEDAHIDFEPILYEYLTLEIPIQPLCKNECKGLCPECGENLNERLCEHQTQLLG